MSDLKSLSHFLYGKGFWYANSLREIEGLTDEQLFWIPDPNALCALWEVGHVAHRERFHIGKFLQGLEGDIIPPQFEVFGPDWVSVDEIRDSIASVDSVRKWVRDVRVESHAFIDSLSEEDFYKVPETSEFDKTVAEWLYITVSHGALHIGRIQLLRAMIEGKKVRAC